MDFHAAEFGQNSAQFTMAYQGLTPDQGDLERTVTPNDINHASHQIVAPGVRQLSERKVPAQMIFTVGVAARTGKWALPRNLD
jgi:hypothetical protein